MWKLFLGFIIFAAAGLWLLSKYGDKVDMGGEKHDVAGHVDEASAPASATLPAMAPAASQ